MINKDEIVNLTKENKKSKHTEQSKMETIEKNIKKRAVSGLYYYDYHAIMTYSMAKEIISCGYKLFEHKRFQDKVRKIELEEFAKASFYNVRISWEE